ncbi:BMC domain-containing protein [Desulfoluna spongiiphila]|uniref:Carboxysome shell and ethanolamine utilization microcompartment protein CcmL/EutN n=1 Tax=Desulfoluna spongiiphila TaxID=419481 RepID=A0A1G5JLU7_9BACT|nr:BMC domain-containing protein [Desulfoluna spongiiphila]SCY89333.1 Carboxysome shell and ethanolamine utilization microcompartment protein CcmL/EutN [Desulfoluna spongiiphila]VVS91716.1 polyhedral organelle shell protein pdut [Desulfoluna spongiiphila]
MDSLGIIESRSIAAGAVLTDIMVKAAGVTLLRAGTICSGRYMIHVAGDRESVATSVSAAQDAGYALAGSYTIGGVSPQVLDALKRGPAVRARGAIGVVECRTASAGIAAADEAVKRSEVELARIVTGQGINGKSYFVLTGDVASVEESVAAARQALGKSLVEAVVIPSPDASVVSALVKRV